MDTIFAEATPPGRGGVSVFRLSGPEARAVLENLAGPVARARECCLRGVKDRGELIDRALVVWFQEGHSFTGEEVAEFHLHGAPVIGKRLEQAFLDRGLRRAEAGEFTRRAFLNGQISLADAEGLADLLAAETEAQRRLAMKAADGEIGRVAGEMRRKLVRAGALIEVSIDFADEEVPDDVPLEALELITEIREEISRLIKSYPATERLRQGYEVAIIGPPNAGKSTLLNRIAQRDVALVSDIAGTTRDVIELRMDLRGLPVTLLDTAGLRDSGDIVEQMGVMRARQRADAADLRVHLSTDGSQQEGYRHGDLVLKSKCDSATFKDSVSGLTGNGVDNLLDRLYDELRKRVVDSGLISHKRQAEAFERACHALEVEAGVAPEFLAEAIRQANTALLAVVGMIGAEDYLDEIFLSFCIGK